MTTIETTGPDLSPGVLLLHYKGTKMKVLHEARETTHAHRVIVYVHLDDGEIWARPVEDFSEQVVWSDGVRRSRFINVSA